MLFCMIFFTKMVQNICYFWNSLKIPHKADGIFNSEGSFWLGSLFEDNHGYEPAHNLELVIELLKAGVVLFQSLANIRDSAPLPGGGRRGKEGGWLVCVPSAALAKGAAGLASSQLPLYYAVRQFIIPPEGV